MVIYSLLIISSTIYWLTILNDWLKESMNYAMRMLLVNSINGQQYEYNFPSSNLCNYAWWFGRFVVFCISLISCLGRCIGALSGLNCNTIGNIVWPIWQIYIFGLIGWTMSALRSRVSDIVLDWWRGCNGIIHAILKIFICICNWVMFAEIVKEK